MSWPTDIATLADVLSYLGKGSSATDTEIGQLQMLKVQAERAVRRWLGCNINQATYTHYLPKGSPYDELYRESVSRMGNVRRYRPNGLLLPEYPLRSVTTLHEDEDGRFGQATGAFADSNSLLTAGEDYYIPFDTDGYCKRAVIHKVRYNFLSAPGSYKVVYVAGWTQDELHARTNDPTTNAADIVHAVCKTVGEFWWEKKNQESDKGPVKSEALDDWSAVYDTSGAGPTINLPPDVKSMLQPFKRAASRLL